MIAFILTNKTLTLFRQKENVIKLKFEEFILFYFTQVTKTGKTLGGGAGVRLSLTCERWRGPSGGDDLVELLHLLPDQSHDLINRSGAPAANPDYYIKKKLLIQRQKKLYVKKSKQVKVQIK